jgi:hypothetical protein
MGIQVLKPPLGRMHMHPTINAHASHGCPTTRPRSNFRTNGGKIKKILNGCLVMSSRPSPSLTRFGHAVGAHGVGVHGWPSSWFGSAPTTRGDGGRHQLTCLILTGRAQCVAGCRAALSQCAWLLECMGEGGKELRLTHFYGCGLDSLESSTYLLYRQISMLSRS